ncbi:hypothetical protein N24_1850 [Corynebacterium suranareeae]|uniref:Uncharacterized protein n=1 Tax=Corynebacterium suranareeae TaxID=2506452 RepID=A0A161JP16_9CORY|nr:hypothetical protein N24_1850 [Corynebacterium suranareeae]
MLGKQNYSTSIQSNVDVDTLLSTHGVYMRFYIF